MEHTDWKITRFVKVKENKSPYDGDFLYWASRMGKYREGLQKAAVILKRQKGKCSQCGLYFRSEDEYELEHLDGNKKNFQWVNLSLVHERCSKEVCMTSTTSLRSRMS